MAQLKTVRMKIATVAPLYYGSWNYMQSFEITYKDVADYVISFGRLCLL